MRDRTDNQQFYCRHCLHGFSSKLKLKNHLPDCTLHGYQHIELPEAGTPEAIIKFKSWYKTLEIPCIIYADFEAVNRKINKSLDS